MANLPLISGEFKQQCKLRYLIIISFHQNTVAVQDFSQNICREICRNQGNFQITFIARIVGNYVVYDVIGIKIFVFAVCINGNGNRTRQTHRIHIDWCQIGSAGIGYPVLDFSVMYIGQTEFDLVLFVCHRT